MNDNITIASDISSRRVIKIALDDILDDGPIYRFGHKIGSLKCRQSCGEVILPENIMPISISGTEILHDTWDFKTHSTLQAKWQVMKSFYDCISEVLPDLYLFRLSNLVDSTGSPCWATRLSLLILPTVNCSAHVADMISKGLNLQLSQDITSVAHPNHIKIFSLPHHTGCGLNRDSSKYATLLEYYAKLILSPNITHVILVSLGCEDIQPSFLMERSPQIRSKVSILSVQDEGGTQATIDRGIRLGIDICNNISNKFIRTKAPYSALRLALQCGGSDAMSGLTANPLLGLVSDFFVSQGAQSIVAETPELYGAFSSLYPRCASSAVHSKLQNMFKRWVAGESPDPSANPAPGNHFGGISNSIEKSLGSAQKTGFAPISDVCQYGGDPNTSTSGLVLMDTPGYDPVSATGQLLAGSNFLLFSTGRGSCFGLNPLPTLKIASNHYIFQHYTGEIDFDASLFSYESSDILLKELLRLVITTASGSPSSAEILGYGSNEIIFWIESGVN